MFNLTSEKLTEAIEAFLKNNDGQYGTYSGDIKKRRKVIEEIKKELDKPGGTR